MPSATSLLIGRFAKVYLTTRPSEATLATFVSRVDTNTVTLAQQMLEFHQSSDRAQGYADEIATMFFLVLNRPPDLQTFYQAMSLMESGGSLTQLAALAMTVRNGQLNALQTNQQFVDKLATQMFAQPELVSGLSLLKALLVANLNNGSLSRESLIASASQYEHSELKYKGMIDVSLIALAAAGREATAAELSLYKTSGALSVARALFLGAGEIPSGEKLPYFEVGKNQANASKLTISGTVAGDFTMNLLTKISSSVAISNYSLVYSPDAGGSESIVKFSPNLLSNFATIDASGLAKDIKSFNLIGHDSGVEFIGSLAPNTVTGGAGNDRLQGGADKDIFYATAGVDTLIGKAGEDTFVLAPSGTYRTSSASRTNISDFGDGADKLNLTTLFGKTTASASATPIQVDAAPTGAQQTLLAAITANGVVLVNNSGTWLDSNGKLAAATAANIASVFTGVTITDATTNSKSYAAISYDILNGADVWLISNFTGLSAVTVAEIQLIGHIDSPANVDLLTYLRASGTIVV